jgi:hypothetical protein
MTRYTVVWHPAALSDLAELWLESRSRQSLAAASNEIDQLLRLGAEQKGRQVYAGSLDDESLETLTDRIGEIPEIIRWMRMGPLEVFFSVMEPDRQACIWRVRPARTR